MKPIPKRNRSVNWDEEEKKILCSVLKDYSHIIEDKSLNTNTNKNKTKAWEAVHKKFYELNCRQRDLVQLKIQWKGMKVNARKTYGSYKNETNKTGGGARPATPDDYVIEVKDLLNPAELLKDSNPFDSDGPDFKLTTYEVIGPATDVVSLDIPSQECVQGLQPTTYEAKGPATDIVSFDIASQECEQNLEVDLTATPLQTNMHKINARKAPKRNLSMKFPESVSKSSKDLDYVSTMLEHSKKLKDEEHRRRMEMAEEDHKIKMEIQKEKFKCTILEREILELKKTREERLTEDY